MRATDVAVWPVPWHLSVLRFPPRRQPVHYALERLSKPALAGYERLIFYAGSASSRQPAISKSWHESSRSLELGQWGHMRLKPWKRLPRPLKGRGLRGLKPVFLSPVASWSLTVG